MDLRVDPVLQERMDALSDRWTDGQLTPEERDEDETYVHAIQIISILQAKVGSCLPASPRDLHCGSHSRAAAGEDGARGFAERSARDGSRATRADAPTGNCTRTGRAAGPTPFGAWSRKAARHQGDALPAAAPREGSRASGQAWASVAVLRRAYASSGFTTSPATSVRRKSRPWKR